MSEENINFRWSKKKLRFIFFYKILKNKWSVVNCPFINYELEKIIKKV